MDAMVMKGDLSAGSVACVSNILHPVSLARLVMEKTPHCLLVGAGANKFASEMGIPSVSTDELVTDGARREYEACLSMSTQQEETNIASPSPTINDEHDEEETDAHQGSTQGVIGCDTVGCVAFDSEGHVACGTSTGGISFKRAGRVGDSPLIGCGGYADDMLGACSSTGHGESIMKMMLCYKAVSLLDSMSPDEAAHTALKEMWSRVKGRGGLIMINKHGEVGHYGSTERMAWASCVGFVGEGSSALVEHHAPVMASGIDNHDAFLGFQD